MQRIINGKLYDTETAELIHKRKLPFDEPNALYVTRKGTYFHLKGPMGGVIAVLNEKAALRWLEKNGGENVLMERFPDYVEEA